MAVYTSAYTGADLHQRLCAAIDRLYRTREKCLGTSRTWHEVDLLRERIVKAWWAWNDKRPWAVWVQHATQNGCHTPPSV